MSKGKLEFDLPEEQDEFEVAQGGQKLKAAIEAFREISLRQRIKYGLNDGEDKLSVQDMLEKLRTELWEKIEEYEAEGLFG